MVPKTQLILLKKPIKEPLNMKNDAIESHSVDGNMTTTIERVAKLETIGNNLKKEMSGSAFGREPAVIIYHPSRLPGKEEFNALFAASRDQAVEHDIRAGKTGYSIQQGMFTDRLKAWAAVDTVDKFNEALGSARAAELIKLVNERAKDESPVTIDKIKGKLFVKDLTFEELQKLASAGGEEIMSMRQFLDSYQKAANSNVKPGKLSVDIKDGDLTISGSTDKAIEATKVFMEEIKARKLNDQLYMIMQYNIPALNASKKILNDSGVPSVGVISSDILKKEGESGFAAYANKLVFEEGADWLGTKAAELRMIQELINAKRPSMMVYVPPKESEDIGYLVKMLRDYPNIKAVQIDA